MSSAGRVRESSRPDDGPEAILRDFKECFEKAGATFIALNVSAAFHSRYMRSTAAAFREYIETVRFDPPQIPVTSNVRARPYEADEIKTLLSEQICQPVRWT